MPRGRQVSTLQPARHEGAAAAKGGKRGQQAGRAAQTSATLGGAGGGTLTKAFATALTGEDDDATQPARRLFDEGPPAAFSPSAGNSGRTEAAAEAEMQMELRAKLVEAADGHMELWQALPPTVPAPEEAFDKEDVLLQTCESVATREGSQESLPEPQYIGLETAEPLSQPGLRIDSEGEGAGAFLQLEAEPQRPSPTGSEAGSRQLTGRRASGGGGSAMPSARKGAEARTSTAMRRSLPSSVQSQELAKQLKSRDEEIARLRQQLKQSKQECLRLRQQAVDSAPAVEAAPGAEAVPPASPGSSAAGGRGGAGASPGRQRRVGSGQFAPTPRSGAPAEGGGRRSAARRPPGGARAQLGAKVVRQQAQLSSGEMEMARVVCEEDELMDRAALATPSVEAPCARRVTSDGEEACPPASAEERRSPAGLAPRPAPVVAPPGGAATTATMVAAVASSNVCTVRSVQDMLSATWDGSTPLAPAPALGGMKTSGGVMAKESPLQASPQPLPPQPAPARSASASPLPRASRVTGEATGVVVWRGHSPTQHTLQEPVVAAAAAATGPARVVVQRATLQQPPPVPFNTPVRAVTSPQAGPWPPTAAEAAAASPVLGLRMGPSAESATLSPSLGTRSLAKRAPQKILAGDRSVELRGLQQALHRPPSLERLAAASAQALSPQALLPQGARLQAASLHSALASAPSRAASPAQHSALASAPSRAASPAQHSALASAPSRAASPAQAHQFVPVRGS